jgi:PhnB protein
MQLIPYLYFNGNCEEALNTYKDILLGEIEIIERYDNPAIKVPEEYRDRILHAVLKFGDNRLFASDVMPGYSSGNPNIALSLTIMDLENSKEIFRKLSENGEIKVPYQKQFWGEWHGNLIDRFGIFWMVNSGD